MFRQISRTHPIVIDLSNDYNCTNITLFREKIISDRHYALLARLFPVCQTKECHTTNIYHRVTAIPGSRFARSRYVILNEVKRNEESGWGRQKCHVTSNECETSVRDMDCRSKKRFSRRPKRPPQNDTPVLYSTTRFSRRVRQNAPQNDRVGISSLHIIHNQILHFVQNDISPNVTPRSASARRGSLGTRHWLYHAKRDSNVAFQRTLLRMT